MCAAAVSLRKPQTDLTATELRNRFSALLEKAPPGVLKGHPFFSIPAHVPPWFDTGLMLHAGEQVTTIAAGTAILSAAMDLVFHPDMQLWFRVGEKGRVFRGTRQTHTFTVTEPGRLYLGSYFPGEWCTQTGAVSVGTEAYRLMTGGLEVLVLRWAMPPLERMKQLLSVGDAGSLLAGEVDRLENPSPPPAGWDYLWFLGPSETYVEGPAAPGGQASIACHTHRDAAILHREVRLPLTPDARLRWSWNMQQLPCEQPENTLDGHDYLSIAVELDNGQDLSFFWSSQLPVDTGFRCPIPTWTARETHVVARSGSALLGRWLDEERPLFSSYERFVGTIGRRDEAPDPRVVAPPTRIERVWLIANSMFKRREGRCEYGAIEIESGGRLVRLN